MNRRLLIVLSLGIIICLIAACSLSPEDPCPACDGSGNCTLCNGSGTMYGDTCPRCDGDGDCNYCGGSGENPN